MGVETTVRSTAGEHATQSTQIGLRIECLMRRKGIAGGTEISRVTGIPQSTMQRILSGALKAPRVDHLLAIARALNVSILALIEDNAERLADRADTQAVISQVEGVPEDDRAVVLRLCGLLRNGSLSSSDKALLVQLMDRLGES